MLEMHLSEDILTLTSLTSLLDVNVYLFLFQTLFSLLVFHHILLLHTDDELIYTDKMKK